MYIDIEKHLKIVSYVCSDGGFTYIS